MATMQAELLGLSPDSKEVDLHLLVQEATWKEVLVELVHRNQFDPWNVDIGEIVDKYIETVKALRVMDLRVPANIILASAVLLRLKSEMLGIEEVEESEAQHYERPDVEVEDLSLRLRPQVKRRIALVELIQALEEAMAIKERREASSLLGRIDVPITINSIDIEEEMEKLYGRIKSCADSKNMTTFSYLSESAGSSDVLSELFVPMLFLAHKDRVYLTQENFFGEIIIQLN